jgi:cytoskeletal protein CcmA (bactofilin family)
MTIFQRGDKPMDKAPDKSATSIPGVTPVPREVPRDKTGAVDTGAKPVLATAQPSSPVAAASKPQPIQGSPMSNVTSMQTQSVSVISKALKITGQLESSEDIQIDGQIEGDVRGVHVKVGQNAKVKGTVYGEEVEVAGTVEGKVEAKKVVLAATAHLAGDVVHQDVRIESGAFINGHLKPEFGKTVAKSAPPVSAARTAAE